MIRTTIHKLFTAVTVISLTGENALLKKTIAAMGARLKLLEKRSDLYKEIVSKRDEEIRVLKATIGALAVPTVAPVKVPAPSGPPARSFEEILGRRPT